MLRLVYALLFAAVAESACVYNSDNVVLYCDECSGKKVDIFLILDSSASISGKNFEKVKQFATQLIKQTSSEFASAEFSVTWFSTGAELVPLAEGDDAFQQTIANYSRMAGVTHMRKGYDLSYSDLVANARFNEAERFLIMLTDGDPNGLYSFDSPKCPDHCGRSKKSPSRCDHSCLNQAAATRLKKNGTTVIQVGVGDKPAVALLNKMASKPIERFSRPKETWENLLTKFLPYLIDLLCFHVETLTPDDPCEEWTHKGVTYKGNVTAVGKNLFDMGDVKCKYTYEVGGIKPYTKEEITPGWVTGNNTFTCPMPHFPASPMVRLDVSRNGDSYTENHRVFVLKEECETPQPTWPAFMPGEPYVPPTPVPGKGGNGDMSPALSTSVGIMTAACLSVCLSFLY